MSRSSPGKPLVIGSQTQPGSQNIKPEARLLTSPLQLIRLAVSPATKPGAGPGTVVALCGATAPTITGGYAKWAVVDRPQRVGLTVFQGYDPLTLTLDLLLDRVAANYSYNRTPPDQRPTSEKAPPQVEKDMATLDFMAGRGFYNGTAPAAESPIVHVSSTDRDGNPTGLIPSNAREWDYIVTGLTYDPSPLHSSTGERVRQQVTVVLTQYIDSPGAHKDSSAYREALTAADGTKYKTFRLTKANNTILKITVNLARNANFAAAQAVLAANRQQNAELIVGRSIKSDLLLHNPLGTPVRVPLTVIDGLI